MKNPILLYLFAFPFIMSAQKDSTTAKLKLKVEVQTGITTYLGELNNREIKFTNNNILTYKAGIGTTYKHLSVLLNFTKGGYAQYQSTTLQQNNFRNNFWGGGLDIQYSFIKTKSFEIYGGAGVNYLKVESRTDLFDKDGKKYNYWNDGTIRDKPESYENIFSSTQIKRDYNYETKIGTQNILFFPITLGVDFNIFRGIKFGVISSAEFSNKRSINLRVNSKNQEFLFQNSVCVSYTFQHKPKDTPTKYDAVNFNELRNMDSDHDGVADFYDLCPGTPLGKKVDKHGCLPDSDGDGIPDESDKEINTKKGMEVDLNGVGIIQPTLKQVESESPPDTIENIDE